MSGNKEKTCFVISPIGSEGSSDRKQADQIFKYVIEPAIKKAGYSNPLRADRDSNPSMITNTVIQHIFNDDLVIAVLTGHNPNVFYELSLRHGTMKPCVHLIDISSWPPPFNVSGMNMIKYDLRDWSSPEKAIDELVDAIKSLEEARVVVNPISSALAVQKSIISEDAVTKNNAIMTEQMQQFLYEMRQIASYIQKFAYPGDYKLGSSFMPQGTQFDSVLYTQPLDLAKAVPLSENLVSATQPGTIARTVTQIKDPSW